jgi:hypothetical protein
MDVAGGIAQGWCWLLLMRKHDRLLPIKCEQEGQKFARQRDDAGRVVLEKGGRGFKTMANPDATPPFTGLLNVELDPRTQKRTKVTLFYIQADHLPAPADDPRTAPAEYTTH